MQTATIIAAFLLACTTGFFVMIALAKPGWEDADGFHEGEQHTDYDGDR